MVEISESGLAETLAPLLEAAKMHAIVIRNEDKDMGAVVSMDDFEIVRKAKAERLLKAMDRLGNELRTSSAAQGISVEELEKMLDRKAPQGHI